MNKRHLTLSLLAAVLAAAPLAWGQDQTPPAAPPAAAPAHPGRKGKGERHPAIRRARRALEVAKRQLDHAAHDFGGHRAKALDLVNQAISELDAALQYDKK